MDRPGSSTVLSLCTHDHACSIYTDFKQQKDQFVPYLWAGLEAGERCFYLAGHNDRQVIIAALEEGGFNLQPYIDRSAFLLVSSELSYLPEHNFDGRRMVAVWENWIHESKEKGFSSLRASAEMTWANLKQPGSEHLATYEVQLNSFVLDHKISFLCQYHRRQFSPELLQAIVYAHPIIVAEDSSVLANPAYLKPETYVEGSGEMQLQAVLDTLMNTKMLNQANEDLQFLLDEQKRVQKEVRKLEREKRKREVAAAEERQYRLIAEAIPQIVFTADENGRADFVNPYFTHYTGLTIDSALAQGWSSIFHPQDAERVFDKWQSAVKGGVPVEIEFRVKATDGSFRWHLCRAVPVLGVDKKVSKWLATCADIDRQKELTVELAAARDRALQHAMIKSHFLAAMSHEIRTPMSAVIGMCNILLRTPLEPVQYHYASNIREGAAGLLSVINDILDFSKIEAGKLPLESIEFDLAAVVESVSDLLAITARNKNLALHTYVDPGRPTRLLGDPQRLKQILINLLANAVKFSNQGEIVLRAEVEGLVDGGAQLRFSVQDEGIGIEPALQAQLFQPYTQADGSISRRYGGTGLGLSICKGLVDLMNGKISLKSEPGRGSTFWFTLTLPVKDSRPASQTLLKEPGLLKDKPILIVDANVAEGQILSSYVSSLGMRPLIVLSPADAKDALRAAQDGQPYLVALLAQEVAGVDGLTLARELAGSAGAENCRLVLVSNLESPQLGDQVRDAGCAGYVIKPVHQAQLLVTVANCLGGRESFCESLESNDSSCTESGVIQWRDEIVLIVEDHPINQRVAEVYLQQLGFRTKVVNNGQEALDALSQGKFDLVLMDCAMPVMDGYTATRAIRAAETGTDRHIPVIAMTGQALDEDQARCIEAGMDAYLSKPVDSETLAREIARFLPCREPK